MKIFARHIIILFGLLISFYQSAHIFTHACIEQDENKKELIEYTDHKCNLCTTFSYYIHSEFEFSQLKFEDFKQFNTYNKIEDVYNHLYSPLYFQLRAPPILI